MQIPDESVAKAAGVIRHEMRASRDIDPEALARAALEAAAPAMAEAVARKITDHMNEHGPAPASPGVTLHETMRRAWHRHFRIAAQVAATAFYDEDDMKRIAAEALAAGRFVACDAEAATREEKT